VFLDGNLGVGLSLGTLVGLVLVMAIQGRATGFTLKCLALVANTEALLGILSAVLHFPLSPSILYNSLHEHGEKGVGYGYE
jgi:hypothetical protein